MNNIKVKDYLLLHVLLFLYSLNGVFSKLASQEGFLSKKFIFYYGLTLLGLFIYAILWQQILKKISLTTAFANKGVVIIWGIIWGNLFFAENIKINKLLGIILIIIGIYMVVKENE